MCGALATVALLSSCGNSNSEAEVSTIQFIDIPEFPYRDTVTVDENSDDDWQILGGENGLEGISDKIRYPELPERLRDNPYADSLLQLYNQVLAYNTLAYDVTTATWFINNYDGAGVDIIRSLENINLAGIKDKEIRDALKSAACESSAWLQKGEDPNDHEINAVGRYYDRFDEINRTLIESHIDRNERFEPAYYIQNYDTIHFGAMEGDGELRKELALKALNESDFTTACIFAREFAYANYQTPETDDEELVAVVDTLLKKGEYSPLLNELWLIWRTAMQFYFGGMSNDSQIFNLFYNDMRNTVALNYISHMADNPEDKLAFRHFYTIIMEHNIVRGYCLVGNSAIFDDMDIYGDVRRNRGE